MGNCLRLSRDASAAVGKRDNRPLADLARANLRVSLAHLPVRCHSLQLPIQRVYVYFTTHSGA